MKFTYLTTEWGGFVRSLHYGDYIKEFQEINYSILIYRRLAKMVTYVQKWGRGWGRSVDLFKGV